ncbi:hypothetical protein N8I77_001417 [Diaporthe amygdali]|uniref:Uncharacterized protein n=1 Tax=Phomopsis amygdali TaxID=1214568 RepID=A0AAD9SRL8_PHOAM|nr:hypothetical protein N8I77_001417 [Diaporthe amygdali]
MKIMIPASTATAVFLAAAASLLLRPALAISSSNLGNDIVHVHKLNPGDFEYWAQAQDTTAPVAHIGHQIGYETDKDEGAERVTQAMVQQPGFVGEQTPTQLPKDDNRYLAMEGTPLDGGSEPELRLKRSEDGGEVVGPVLLSRETSAAPTVFGVSIWLILAWLALLYFMYKTGSMF